MSLNKTQENNKLKNQGLDQLNPYNNRTSTGNITPKMNSVRTLQPTPSLAQVASSLSSSNNSNMNNNNNNNNNNNHITITNDNDSEIKGPKTPSLPKSSTFASPAQISIIPETPERVPRHIQNFDDTPLLSPPQTSNNNLLQTPQRRNGNDFYSLLKSPEVRFDDKNLKRRSVELFNVTSVKSPEQIHKEYDSDHLLKSPKRDYKEIRKISENLRTRLNYAHVKFQHGWSNKSIGELEHSLEEIASSPRRNISNPIPSTKEKELEDFWNLKTNNLPGPKQESDIQFNNNYQNNSNQSNINNNNNNNQHKSPRRSSFVASVKLDEIAKRGFRSSVDQKSSEFSVPLPISTSMQSNSSSKSSLLGYQTSPIKPKEKNNLSINTNEKKKDSQALEQDAIISLISLSSPNKYQSGSSFSPSPPKQFASPTKSFSGGLPSLDGVSNKMLPPLPNSLNMPLSAPGILNNESTSRRHSSSSDGNVQNRYKFPNHQTTLGLGMGITMSSNSSNNNNNVIHNRDDDETDDETTEEEIIDDD